MTEQTHEPEQWRTITDPPEHEDQLPYEVSNYGRVRSLNKGFEGKILKGGEGPANTDPGIRKVWLTNPWHSSNIRARVDKLVAVAFLGQQPPGTRLIHKNACVWDDRASNLLWESTELTSSIHTPLPTHGQPTVEHLTRLEGAAWLKVENLRIALGQATSEALKASKARVYAEALGEAQTGVQGPSEVSDGR